MKKILPLLFICLFFATTIKAQQKPNVVLPDVNKLMSMTPAEMEAYKKQMLNQASKQAKEISQQANIKLDESVLPDYELQLRGKDLKRISTIPTGVPTLMELTSSIKTTKQKLESQTAKTILDGVKNLVSTQNGAQLQSSSIAHWYADNPVAALLLSMESAIKIPDTAIAWNNLAAFLNMSGLEEKSIPILKHWLDKLPQNSLLLNNMGQAWLGLGDILTAEDFLKQCLAVDSLNPEANRSMAMICAKRNEPEKANEFVKKEQQITQRVSTTTQVEKITKTPLNLYVIYANNPSIPKEKYFESVGLSKFELPPMPQNTSEVEECRKKWEGFGKSVAGELSYWLALAGSPLTEEEKGRDRYETTGLYSKKSERLFRDLNNNFDYMLPLFNDADFRKIMTMVSEFEENYNKPCPDDPTQCCAMKRPIADGFMKQFNPFVKERGTRAMSVWKAYIDGAINILMLDPAPGNKRVAYGLIAHYFSMLELISGAVKFVYPNECKSIPLSKEEWDAIIMSNRVIDFNCPAWLNFEFDLQVAKIKVDCEKFEVEAGKAFMVSYEKDFKTGTSTISAGPAIRQNFAGVVEGELKAMVYITCDNDNNFTDLGVKLNAEVSVGGNPITVEEGIADVGGKLAGFEGVVRWGVNSGGPTSGLDRKGFLAR